MAVAAWLVEKEEKAITMGLHLLPLWYRSPSGELPSHHLAEHEGCANEMDTLHLRKIDLADEIFVINWQQYIGSSTRNEILYAIGLGKKVRYLDNDPLGLQVGEMVMAAMARESAEEDKA